MIVDSKEISLTLPSTQISGSLCIWVVVSDVLNIVLTPTIGKDVHLASIICYLHAQPPSNVFILGYAEPMLNQSIGFHIETTQECCGLVNG